MYRAAFVAVLAAGHAAAFAPTMSAFGGLRRQGAAQRLSSATVRAPRRLAAGAPALRAQLGLNDKESSTAVDDFKKDGKTLSLLEKEQLYLECCAEWNVNKKALITDDEFEDLKSDLEFQGSQVILMSREEIKFMVAGLMYNKGKPTMDDGEFEELRLKLKKQGSLAVKHEATSCRINDDGSKICKADLFADDGKNALLYSPALVLSALLFNEYAFWFNGWDPILSLILGSPFIAAATYGLTNFVYFQNPYITKTLCPECGTPQNIFFGDILFVSGDSGPVVNTKCVNKDCGVKLKAEREPMIVNAVFD